MEAQEQEDEQNEEDIRREKARKEKTLLMEAQEVHRKKALEGMLQVIFVIGSIIDVQMQKRRWRRRKRRRMKRY